jgi:formylglycine-generating enzyme required for sulfatase activity
MEPTPCWAQATQSNTVTGNTIGVAGSANYYDGDYVGSGDSSWPTTNALTDGGAYGLNSDSAYGTNDQAGNVYEWNDAVISGSSRGLRGGAWFDGGSSLASSSRGDFGPSFEKNGIGFRVASVPEPTSIFLTMLAGGVMLARRKR